MIDLLFVLVYAHSLIPSTLIANSITSYASSLVTRIKTGDFKTLAPKWINCTSTALKQTKRSPSSENEEFDPEVPTIADRATTKDLECPLEWAKDSNTYVCSTVFKGYQASDLGGAYYKANAPIVDQQIAKVWFI